MTTSLGSRCRIVTGEVGAGSAVEVSGILDWHSAPCLRSTLSGLADGSRVLVDLAEVERIDASGTGELIAAAVRLGRTGIEMGIVTGCATADVLESVGIGDSVLVFSNRSPAYRWLSGERAGHPLGR